MSDKKISIVLGIKNRAHLFKYCLESLSRQNYDLDKVEICIGDGGSNDNLLNLIDRYSDVFTFKYAIRNEEYAPIPIISNQPAARINTVIKNMPSYDKVVKIDPEIVLRDEWILQEISDNIDKDDSRTYNVRTHFTEGDTWYMNYEDIINGFEKHYHYAEGGPFSRSKFYFCSGFSREKYIKMGGIEEMCHYGVGYDDTLFREIWKNRYGSYEHEITGQAIHLWHGPNQSPPNWEELNKRIFHHLKHMSDSNVLRLEDEQLKVVENPVWGIPEMLSKIYTIKDGEIIKEEKPSEVSQDLDLPF